MTGDSFTMWRQKSTKVLTIPLKLEDKGAMLLMLTFKWYGSHNLEKDVSSLKDDNAYLVFKYVYVHFKEMSKYLEVFKNNALRKREEENLFPCFSRKN